VRQLGKGNEGLLPAKEKKKKEKKIVQPGKGGEKIVN